MGGVYEVLDREQERRVALKTLRNLDAKALLRFKREYRALLDLHHHNLVRLGELIEEDGQWFFTMELIEGTNFFDYCRHGADNLVDERRVRRSLAQLTNALLTLHAANQVHRDIKPSNILVTRTGRVVLLDFGLAADTAGDPIQSMDTPLGTSEFMAPEQALANAVGPEADWYSMGAVLFHTLTGQYPFGTGDPVVQLRKKQREEPPPPRYLAPKVSAELNDLCVKLQRLDPAERIGGEAVLAVLGEEVDEPDEEPVEVPFVGRTNELDALRDATSVVVSGNPAVVNIRGESGVGKSSLLDTFVKDLEQQHPDSLVLEGRCYHLESVPYKAIDQAIDQLAAYLGARDTDWVARIVPKNVRFAGMLFPVLRRVRTIANAVQKNLRRPPPNELRIEGFAALRDLLCAIAEHHVVALVLDDMQWADADSKALLAALWRPPTPPAILGVFLTRLAGDPAAESTDWLPIDVHKLELGVLSDEAAAKLSEVLIERFAPPELTPGGLVRSAQGHPFFMVELARYASVKRSTGDDLSVTDLLWQRIAELDERSRRLLQLIAIAAAPVPQGIAARACVLEFAQLVEVAEDLHNRHLVTLEGVHPRDVIDVYHGLVRATVIGKLSEPERRDLHRSLADALEHSEDSERSAELLATHLEAAGETRRAAEFSEHAARQASEQLAFERAANFFQRALDLGGHPDRKARALTIELAESLVNAGRAAEAVPHYLEAALSGNAASRLDCRRRAAEQLLVSGRIDRGVNLLNEVLREIDQKLPSTPRRALVSMLWQRTRLRISGIRWHERDESQLAPWDLVRLDALNAVARGLIMVDPIRGLDFQCRMLRLALKLGERQRIAQGTALYAISISTAGTGSIERARKLLRHAEEIAAETKDPGIEAWVYAGRGFVEYFAGSFAKGHELLDAGGQKIRTEATGMSWELNSIVVGKLWTLRQMGGFRQMARVTERAVDDALRRGDLYTETSVRRAGNLVWLGHDDPVGAEEDLGRATWSPPEGRFHLQHYWELESRGQIVLYQQRAIDVLESFRGQFKELDQSLIPRIQMVRVNTNWLRARLLVGAHAAKPDAAYLREAAAISKKLKKERIDVATLDALLVDAGIASQKKNRELVVACLQQMLPMALANDMALHAAVARRLLGTLIGGSVGAEQLRDADSWFEQESIQNPEAMCSMVAPGVVV